MVKESIQWQPSTASLPARQTGSGTGYDGLATRRIGLQPQRSIPQGGQSVEEAGWGFYAIKKAMKPLKRERTR